MAKKTRFSVEDVFSLKLGNESISPEHLTILNNPLAKSI